MSDNTNNGFPVPEEPLTREEQYLSAIAGVTEASEIPEKPLTRVEAYLNKIVENGGGGGSSFEPTDEQLAAMNSGITAEDVEQISTNKNNILMFEQQNSTKNRLNFTAATDKATNCTTSNKTSKSIDISTDTIWAFYNYAILLPAGDYVAMIKVENYATTGETDSRFGVFKTDSATQGAGTTTYFHTDGTYISTFTADGTSTYYPTIYLNPSGTAADISLTADNIMVIPKSIYDEGYTDYSSYAMTNAEITAWILAQS